MTYPEAVRTILNREDKDQIFKESLYLCAYLSDFLGNDLSQKHLLDVLMSLIKGESPKALLDEKELTRVANKNMFYPKEDVFQALSPFMKKRFRHGRHYAKGRLLWFLFQRDSFE